MERHLMTSVCKCIAGHALATRRLHHLQVGLPAKRRRLQEMQNSLNASSPGAVLVESIFAPQLPVDLLQSVENVFAVIFVGLFARQNLTHLLRQPVALPLDPM